MLPPISESELYQIEVACETSRFDSQFWSCTNLQITIRRLCAQIRRQQLEISILKKYIQLCEKKQ